ncbi:MAG: hypothetical protein NTV05_03255 [Acidobacteria bacterium]|nr:hypothetical protein [Acidobacteriota bacterium]
MEASDILAYVHRDWQRVADAKTAFWLETKRGLAPDDALTIGGLLYKQVRRARPDWLGEADRSADLAVHVRVTEALRAVFNRPV